jgi:hypothetical protein
MLPAKPVVEPGGIAQGIPFCDLNMPGILQAWEGNPVKKSAFSIGCRVKPGMTAIINRTTFNVETGSNNKRGMIR